MHIPRIGQEMIGFYIKTIRVFIDPNLLEQTNLTISKIHGVNIMTSKLTFNNNTSWKENIRQLKKELVPEYGEAETLQGELVRCIQNIAAESDRNGLLNWNSRYEGQLDILKKFLTAPNVFSDLERRDIRPKITLILYAGREGADKGFMADDEIDFIAERVVEWCKKCPTLIRKPDDVAWINFEITPQRQ